MHLAGRPRTTPPLLGGCSEKRIVLKTGSRFFRMARPMSRTKSELERAFERFHTENPHVYDLFKKYTHQAIRAGRDRFGAQSIIERIRWYTAIETKGDSFKINNNHARYYARLFMREHPVYEDFFRTRRAG